MSSICKGKRRPTCNRLSTCKWNEDTENCEAKTYEELALIQRRGIILSREHHMQGKDCFAYEDTGYYLCYPKEDAEEEEIIFGAGCQNDKDPFEGPVVKFHLLHASGDDTKTITMCYDSATLLNFWKQLQYRVITWETLNIPSTMSKLYYLIPLFSGYVDSRVMEVLRNMHRINIIRNLDITIQQIPIPHGTLFGTHNSGGKMKITLFDVLYIDSEGGESINTTDDDDDIIWYEERDFSKYQRELAISEGDAEIEGEYASEVQSMEGFYWVHQVTQSAYLHANLELENRVRTVLYNNRNTLYTNNPNKIFIIIDCYDTDDEPTIKRILYGTDDLPRIQNYSTLQGTCNTYNTDHDIKELMKTASNALNYLLTLINHISRHKLEYYRNQINGLFDNILVNGTQRIVYLSDRIQTLVYCIGLYNLCEVCRVLKDILQAVETNLPCIYLLPNYECVMYLPAEYEQVFMIVIDAPRSVDGLLPIKRWGSSGRN